MARNAINAKQKICLGVNKYIEEKSFSLYTEMDCGTTNLHYCDECGERKRELSFTYQVIKKETVKKNVIRLENLEHGVYYKPVEIIEDERMRVLKLEDEKGEFHFIDQKRYSLNKEVLYYYEIESEEKKAKAIDLLSVLESFIWERGSIKPECKNLSLLETS